MAPARRADAPAPEPGADAATVENLKAKAALQAQLIEGMRTEKTGEPIEWSKDIPAGHRSDQFQDTVSRALDEIESPLEPVQFECSEPPCISVLRGIPQGDRPGVEMSKYLHDLAVSEAWKAAYGDEFALGEIESVDCGQGRTEWVLMMAPSIDNQESPYQEANLKLRMKDRSGRVVSGWACRPAGP